MLMLTFDSIVFPSDIKKSLIYSKKPCQTLSKNIMYMEGESNVMK